MCRTCCIYECCVSFVRYFDALIDVVCNEPIVMRVRYAGLDECMYILATVIVRAGCSCLMLVAWCYLMLFILYCLVICRIFVT